MKFAQSISQQNTNTSIFVCKDLFGQQKREIYSFKIDFHSALFCHGHGVNRLILSLSLIGLGKGYLTIVFQRHYKMFLQRMLDKHHVIGRSIPNIVQNIAKLNAILDTGL